MIIRVQVDIAPIFENHTAPLVIDELEDELEQKKKQKELSELHSSMHQSDSALVLPLYESKKQTVTRFSV
ncbi:hypothetical protein QW180_01905 [Vibrio sinaloensis]|nr:hypothetical protein [Vibrio sinaloensis]